MEKRQGGRKGWKDGGIVEGEKEGGDEVMEG